jgi:hypothetical protein
MVITMAALAPTLPAVTSTNIFEQYNSILAHEVVEQLRPILEAYVHPATGVQQRLFDVDQAAVYIGRTPKAVHLLISRGKIPVTKAFDSKVQIDRTVLEKLIAAGTFYES